MGIIISFFTFFLLSDDNDDYYDDYYHCEYYQQPDEYAQAERLRAEVADRAGLLSRVRNIVRRICAFGNIRIAAVVLDQSE